ncbi:hypothetical protein HaLaN_23663, partial [Haematococcus lacustris]
MLLFLITGGGT